MNFIKLFQYGLIAASLLGNAIAMDDNKSVGELLIVGCRPWDSNIQEVKGLETAHFVDFLMEYGSTPPESLPSNFHHFDVNDKESNSSGKFSDFTKNNIAKYTTIIIDWATYQHVHRDSAWTDFSNLLKPGGKLVVPICQSLPIIQFISLYFAGERYSLELMSDLPQNGIPELNKIYLEKSDDKLKCFVIAPDEKPAKGELNIKIDGELSADTLRQYKNNILMAAKDQDSNRSPDIARELIERNQLTMLFNTVDIYTYEEIPSDVCFDILRRPEIPQRWIHFKPAIIFATKKAAEEISLNIPVVIETKENVIVVLDPFPVTTTPEISIEKENIINEAVLELSTHTSTTTSSITEITIENENMINETVLELSPQTATTTSSIQEGYREVKFPSLDKLKEILYQGRSTIYSETGDGFYVGSIMGLFHGFSPEAQVKKFDLKMQSLLTSKDGLFGMFRVLFEDSNGIGMQINLKSYDKPEGNYIVTGGAQKKENFYFVSDPEELQIITLIKKREAEKVFFKAPTVTITTEPVLSPKPTIIRSLTYCPNLYRKLKTNEKAIEKIHYDESHNIQDRKSRDLLLEIRRELREAEDIIDTIESPHTTTHDRTLVAALFSSDRLEEMQRYMVAAKKLPELSSWLQEIGFNW